MGPNTAVSMFLGTLVGWGLLAPMAHAKGWTTGPIKDVGTGPTGWLLWISLAIMLADSVVSLSVVLIKILRPQLALSSSISKRRSDNENSNKQTNNDGSIEDDDTAVDPAPLDQQISWRIWLPGLVVASLVCTGILTPMFAMPPWQPAFAVLFSLLVAVLAIRALGETDLNPVSGIGKVSQLLFAVVAPGNLVANLVAGAVAEAGAMAAGDMMQDLKCGHLRCVTEGAICWAARGDRCRLCYGRGGMDVVFYCVRHPRTRIPIAHHIRLAIDGRGRQRWRD